MPLVPVTVEAGLIVISPNSDCALIPSNPPRTAPVPVIVVAFRPEVEVVIPLPLTPVTEPVPSRWIAPVIVEALIPSLFWPTNWPAPVAVISPLIEAA